MVKGMPCLTSPQDITFFFTISSSSAFIYDMNSCLSTDIHFHPYHLFVSSISSTVIHFHPSMVNGQWSSTVINFHPSLSIFILQSLKNNYGRILMAETRVRGSV